MLVTMLGVTFGLGKYASKHPQLIMRFVIGRAKRKKGGLTVGTLHAPNFIDLSK